MKKSLIERSFVVVLFVLVLVIFSFAQRDTQKVFEKYNMKSTVDIQNKTLPITVEVAGRATSLNKQTRN